MLDPVWDIRCHLTVLLITARLLIHLMAVHNALMDMKDLTARYWKETLTLVDHSSLRENLIVFSLILFFVLSLIVVLSGFASF